MIVVLTGGTGGAKFVDGLRRIVPPEELTIIVNTGDDHEWWGMYVSPDLDSITYVLAGILSNERGWGVRGDTFHCLQTMKELGEPAWFSVGDLDYLYTTGFLATVGEYRSMHVPAPLQIADHVGQDTPRAGKTMSEIACRRR